MNKWHARAVLYLLSMIKKNLFYNKSYVAVERVASRIRRATEKTEVDHLPFHQSTTIATTIYLATIDNSTCVRRSTAAHTTYCKTDWQEDREKRCYLLFDELAKSYPDKISLPPDNLFGLFLRPLLLAAIELNVFEIVSPFAVSFLRNTSRVALRRFRSFEEVRISTNSTALSSRGRNRET